MNLADLEDVQSLVNRFPYQRAVIDDWHPITQAGGACSTYVSGKMKMLTEKYKWPIEPLRYGECTWNGDLHLVLSVLLDGKEWILSNGINGLMSLADADAQGMRPIRVQLVGGKPQWVEWFWK